MLGFAVCVLVEWWFLSVRSTLCSFGLGTSLHCSLAIMGLERQLHAGSCCCPALSLKAFWV